MKEEVLKVYELIGLEPGPINFPLWGTLDMREIDLETAHKIHEKFPEVLGKRAVNKSPRTQAQDPEA